MIENPRQDSFSQPSSPIRMRILARDSVLGLLIGVFSFYVVVPALIGRTGLLREFAEGRYIVFWFIPVYLFPSMIVVTALLRPKQINEAFFVALRLFATCFLVLILDYAIKQSRGEYALTLQELAEDVGFDLILFGFISLLLSYLSSRILWTFRFVLSRLRKV